MSNHELGTILIHFSYVLTNRHIVGAGPFWGSIAFYNQEEVDAFPVYRDPIHDFGILRFNPEDVKHTDISALTLRPDLAKGNFASSLFLFRIVDWLF